MISLTIFASKVSPFISFTSEKLAATYSTCALSAAVTVSVTLILIVVTSELPCPCFEFAEPAGAGAGGAKLVSTSVVVVELGSLNGS